jgi:hypothetical protein
LRENYSFRDDLRRRLLPALAGAIAFSCLTQAALADQASAFKQALAQGYQEIAKFIDLRTHDTAGQSYFRNKSDRASALYDVDPDWPTNWTISHDTQEIMMRDRRSLVTALARLKTGGDPKTEAVAQVNFDCWVALSSVSSLGPESERCRNAFQAALQQIEAP